MSAPRGIQLIRKPVVQRMKLNGEYMFLRTGWFITIVKDKNGVNTGEYFEIGAEKDSYFVAGRGTGDSPYKYNEDNAFLTHEELDISSGLLPMPPGITV